MFAGTVRPGRGAPGCGGGEYRAGGRVFAPNCSGGSWNGRRGCLARRCGHRPRDDKLP